MINQEDIVKIGRFIKPHGVKGELSLLTDTDVLDESEDLYVICDMDGILVPFFVEEYRYKTDTVILVKLEGVDSEEEARMFLGKDVFYPLEAINEEEEEAVGEEDLPWDHLIGYGVTDIHQGYVGQVTGVDTSTINILLRVDREGKEILIPVAEELITDVDPEAALLTVDLPEGLLEL